MTREPEREAPTCPECGAEEPHWNGSKAESDSLRAEVERLTAESEAFRGKLAEQCGQTLVARAEVERLTKEAWETFEANGELAKLVMDLRAEIERLTEAHERIVEWSRAYPLTIFPEPDLKKARALLEAGGMTLDVISARAMRHVIEQVAKISRAALEPSG